MTMDNELREVFRAEVAEQIEQLRLQLRSGMSEWDVQLLFRLAHNIKGAARMVDAVPVRDVAHALEDVFAVLRDGTLGESEDAVRVVRHGCELLEQVFAGLDSLGEIDLHPFRAAVAQLLAGESVELAEGLTAPVAVAVAPKVSEVAKPESPVATEKTLRVSIDKLDRLLEISNELVTAGYRMEERLTEASELQSLLHGREQAGLGGSEASAHLRTVEQGLQQLRRELVKDRSHFAQISGQLRESVRLLRMVRVDSLQGVFARVVEEAAVQTGKQVGLQIVGGDTELDRSVLEGLRDPLVHLLRNAIAHGIEAPAERASRSKPPQAALRLSARVSGGWVAVEVADDGRGIHWERVRQEAVARGVATTEAVQGLAENELADFLFHSGFSTAAKTDDLAGRGVGLDVVRQNVHRMGGAVSVMSQENKGAAFRLQVPLTRLTTKGVLVKLGGHLLAAPITSVAQTTLVEPGDLQEADGGYVVTVNSRPIPAYGLEDTLGLPTEMTGARPAIVVSEGNRQAAFLVDEVLGEKDYLLQPLSWNLRAVKGVSGGAVLDGGRICLVLDANDLLAQRQGGGRQVRSYDSAGTVQKKQILVVDDSVTTRTLEKNILTAAGYGITLALDGEDAWQKLQNGTYDLVISDVEMPRLTGLELCRRIRADSRFQNLPLILVTSLGNDEHKMAGAEAGANAYIVKGIFDQDQLLSTVARLV
jgi:two-component system chemotaxis sensor kinase CheA